MKKLLIFIFLIFIVLPVKISLSQKSETIGPVTTKVICLQYFDGIKMPESAFNSATNTGVYLVIAGQGAKPSDGGCNVTGQAKDNKIWLDLVIVAPNGKKEWVNLYDIPFEGVKVYGGGCQTSASIYIPPSTGTGVQTNYLYYLFDTYCSDGLKSGGQTLSSRAYDLLAELINWPKIIKDNRPSAFFTSRQKKEETSEPSAIQGEAVIDPCSNEGLFQTFLGIIPTGINDKGVACVILKVGLGMTSVILDFISFISKTILKWTIGAATNFQMAFNHVLSGVLNVVARLDPFSRDIGTVVWRTLRDLAYIVLVFSALYAGFIWLFEGKGAAFSLIFNIILVALIINFSYAFVKLVFTIAFQIEDGISGGTKAQFGEFILGALWQGNFIGSWQNIVKDYEKYINKEISYVPQSEILKRLGFDKGVLDFFLNQLVNKIVDVLFDIVNIIAVSLMPLMIAMVISGALAMMIFLFMYRFITIIRLLITSPLAILSLAYPNKGPLGKYLPQFPFTFDNWLSEIVKWAVVIPIFMFMVVLGVVFQQNFVSMSQADVSMEDFLFVFIFLLFWFVFSFNVASGLSGVSANIAKAAAAFPGWALGRLLKFGYRRTPLPFWFGGGLRNVGNFIERRLGNAPIIGWVIGWWLRKFGRSMQNLGSKVMEQHVLVSGREEMRRDLDRAWGAFINNPNPETWRAFIGAFTRLRNVPAFSEDVRNFAERLRGAGLGMLLNQNVEEVNQILGIREVREVIDKNLNNLGTALTSENLQEVRESFIRFLSETNEYEIERIFDNLDQIGWGRFNQLLNAHSADIIINQRILPKLVRIAGSMRRNYLRNWLGNQDRGVMENTMIIASGNAGRLALQSVLQRP
jgi:hypothetical protein